MFFDGLRPNIMDLGHCKHHLLGLRLLKWTQVPLKYIDFSTVDLASQHFLEYWTQALLKFRILFWSSFRIIFNIFLTQKMYNIQNTYASKIGKIHKKLNFYKNGLRPLQNWGQVDLSFLKIGGQVDLGLFVIKGEIYNLESMKN